MSKNHHWIYTNVKHQHVGTMICTACHKPIESGQYRYRETEAAYLPQHRNCSESDKQWAKLDYQKASELETTKQYLEACLEFQKKWGTSDLDDDIESAKDCMAEAVL